MNGMPTVWFVSELYYPEETSTGYYVTGIAEGLAKTFTVKVICSQPTYRARGVRMPARERRNGVEIWRCGGTTFDKNNVVLRALNIFTISFGMLVLAIQLIRRGDAVVVTTNPPSLPFVIRATCAVRGASCVLLMHDVYPEVLIATGFLRSDSAPARLLSALQRTLLRSMSRIVVIGRDMEQLVLRRAGRPAPQVVLIPNWADLDAITPTDRLANPLLAELGISARFVVQYSGNIGRTHGIDGLIEAATRMREDPVQFLMIGDGAMRAYLDDEIRRRRLDNMKRLPARPRGELNVSLNACDVALISLAPGMTGVSVPSRMYNVLAAGKPIIAIAEPDSEIARVVRDEQVGWVVAPGDVDALVRLVRSLVDARPFKDMSTRARDAVERSYSRAQVLRAYVTLLRDLTASRNGTPAN
jgi:glycosyltransferase involved in cell wall biosynthesis